MPDKTFKETLNELMVWMLPHIPYMNRKIVRQNILTLIASYYDGQRFPHHIKKMVKYLNTRTKYDNDVEFLTYCYSLLFYTEGLTVER